MEFHINYKAAAKKAGIAAVIIAVLGGAGSWYHHSQEKAMHLQQQQARTALVTAQASSRSLTLLDENAIRSITAEAIGQDETAITFKQIALTNAADARDGSKKDKERDKKGGRTAISARRASPRTSSAARSRRALNRASSQMAMPQPMRRRRRDLTPSHRNRQCMRLISARSTAPTAMSAMCAIASRSMPYPARSSALQSESSLPKQRAVVSIRQDGYHGFSSCPFFMPALRGGSDTPPLGWSQGNAGARGPLRSSPGCG